MNPNPPPDPLPLIPNGLSDAEFMGRVKVDRRNLAAMDSLAELVGASELGRAGAELRAQSDKLVANRCERVALALVEAKMWALTAVLGRPPGTMDASDRLARTNQIMDELTDELLKTPEPHRTRFLKELLRDARSVANDQAGGVRGHSM